MEQGNILFKGSHKFLSYRDFCKGLEFSHGVGISKHQGHSGVNVNATPLM